jgi:hypothetical protein
MTSYGLQMLKTGEADIPGPELLWMAAWDRWFRLDFQVGLVRGHGICALINTGPGEDLGPMNDLWVQILGERAPMRRDPSWWILTQLERVGVRPEDVTHVILTPLQLYTSSNVPLFPAAEICVSRAGWIHYHTTHDHPHDARWNSMSQEVLRYMTIDAWDRVRLLSDEDEIAPGIRTWWAGGHHRATIAVEVDSAIGTIVVSDVFFHYQNVEANHPLGISENIYETLAAYDRARRVASAVVPLYEPRVFERHPDGVVAPIPVA